MLNYEYDNFDITMCNDGLCSKRKQCHRYHAYQELIQLKDEDRPMLVSFRMSNDKPFDGCNLFWEEKE